MKIQYKSMHSIVLATLLSSLITGCGGGGGSSPTPANGISSTQKNEVLTTYATIAELNYEKALADAQTLQSAINTFATTPNQINLDATKTAWLKARESYGTTEALRLSNGPIDAEDSWIATLYKTPEGQINAWPLDENMIDYTTAADGSTTSGNIIDNTTSFTPNGGSEVNVTTITKEVLSQLNENGGDANVATGYHAIEFLLWGQDQDYASFVADTITNGATTAGQRPLTDFTSGANAQRRMTYLQASADLLVENLTTISNAWQSESTNCTTGIGCYRSAFLGTLTNNDASKNIATDTALKNIFIGLGVFIKSEVANERIAVAVLTPSEEDEHSCFSDNTHRDITTNYQGFKNLLKGEYLGASKGKSFYSLLSTAKKSEIDTLISSIDTKITTLNTAITTEHFDYQIKEGSSYRQNIVNAKNSMRDLGDKMVSVATEFGISLTTDDVTDPDETQL